MADNKDIDLGTTLLEEPHIPDPPSKNGGEEPEEEAPTTIEFSTGIKAHLKPVPPMIIRQASMNVERPKPPTFSPRDGVIEENLGHPDYLAALSDYEAETALAGAEAMIMFGVVSLDIPKGLAKPEEDAWLEDLKELKIEPDVSTTRRRTLAYLYYFGCATSGDLEKLSVSIGRLSAIRDTEVAQAVASFQNRATRRANRSNTS